MASSSFKRPRAPPSPSPSDDSAEAGPSKSLRGDTSNGSAPLLCTLPPTCCPPNGTPTPLANTRELEAHYARAHAHVCNAPKCGKVFPDAHLLDLHFTECHDTLAELRRERGEKIFRCHIATCPKLCATPKTRRLHLIEAHHYPKQYYFAVTNKGIGQLLLKWGEGATMLRGDWKPRSGQQGYREPKQDMDEDEDEMDVEGAKPTTQQQQQQRNVRFVSPPRSEEQQDQDDDEDRPGLGDGVDALVSQLGSLEIRGVPKGGIRFGRGGARGGFVHGPKRGGKAPNIAVATTQDAPADVQMDDVAAADEDGAEDGGDGEKKSKRANRYSRRARAAAKKNKAAGEPTADGS